MNNLMKLALLITFTSITFVDVAMAKNKTAPVSEKAVDVKCFVELVGGGETISLWKIQPSLLKKFTHQIVGQKILLRTNNGKTSSNTKSTVYRAKQCVLETDEFSSSRARALDEGLPK